MVQNWSLGMCYHAGKKKLKPSVYFDCSKLVSKQARATLFSIFFTFYERKDANRDILRKSNQTRASKHVIAFMPGIDKTQK